MKSDGYGPAAGSRTRHVDDLSTSSLLGVMEMMVFTRAFFTLRPAPGGARPASSFKHSKLHGFSEEGREILTHRFLPGEAEKQVFYRD